MEVNPGNINDPESKGKSRLKIMIVEDDFASSLIIDSYLSKYGDCFVAGNGTEAIEAFRNALDKGKPYDLICLDIMMPEMNGHLTLVEIGRIEAEYRISNSDRVKVIMTTAIDESEDMIKAFKEGCKAYIVKPITFEKLLTEMRKLNVIK